MLHYPAHINTSFIDKKMEMIEIRMNQVTLMVQQMMQSLRIWMIFNESASIHDDMVKNDIKNLQDTFKSATLMLSRLEDHVMDIDQLHQTVSNAASTLLQVRDKMESFAKVVQSLQFPVKLSPEEQEWEESRGWVNS